MKTNKTPPFLLPLYTGESRPGSSSFSSVVKRSTRTWTWLYTCPGQRSSFGTGRGPCPWGGASSARPPGTPSTVNHKNNRVQSHLNACLSDLT